MNWSRLTHREATGFVRADMLFLLPPWQWARWYRGIWRECACGPLIDVQRGEAGS